MNPYETCPVIENENFILRLVEAADAAVENLGFAASEEKLVGGHDGRVYGDYYVLFQQ